jgi:hypothetical protein
MESLAQQAENKEITVYQAVQKAVEMRVFDKELIAKHFDIPVEKARLQIKRAIIHKRTGEDIYGGPR